MKVLRPGQRVRLTDGDGYDSDAVVGTLRTFHLYEDGSHAYTIEWWNDRWLGSGCFFPTSFETPEDPEWLEVNPVVNS